jgi:hypothetical protein
MSGTKADEHQQQDAERDEALEDTFPASDPPATGGSTGPEDTPPNHPQR